MPRASPTRRAAKAYGRRSSPVSSRPRRYGRDRLEPYARQLQQRFGIGPAARLLSMVVPEGVSAALGQRLIDRPWFVRHVLLNRWFLHAQQPALALS